jgi:hypothetical protein
MYVVRCLMSVSGDIVMSQLRTIFADAKGHRAEAERARQLARSTEEPLQSELLRIAELYDQLADGKDDLDRDDRTPAQVIAR